MKKLLSLLLLLSLSAPSIAQEFQSSQEIPAPTWTQFCPLQYCSAEFGPISKPPGALFYMGAVMLWPVLLVPYVIKANKSKESFTRNYWANRKQQFNGELELCQHAQDTAMCYMQVRQMEDQKNAEHQAHLDRMAINSSVRQTNASLNQMRYQMIKNH